MKYFKDVRTLEELRRQYKLLLKQYHPDNANGSTAATQKINAEYDQLFKVLKDKHESKSDQTADSTAHKESSYNANMYDWENDKSLREVLQKIINFDGIEIEIVGAWLWVSGNTYSYKKELKEIGFKWLAPKSNGITTLMHIVKKCLRHINSPSPSILRGEGFSFPSTSCIIIS